MQKSNKYKIIKFLMGIVALGLFITLMNMRSFTQLQGIIAFETELLFLLAWTTSDALMNREKRSAEYFVDIMGIILFSAILLNHIMHAVV